MIMEMEKKRILVETKVRVKCLWDGNWDGNGNHTNGSKSIKGTVTMRRYMSW